LASTADRVEIFYDGHGRDGDRARSDGGNAVDDAVGVRLTELPITPEAVYRGLRRATGDPLPEE
jgi:hypothetical protein